MKKFFAFTLVALTLLSVAPAFAATESDPLAVYTVASKFDTGLKNIFTLDEKPWLYINIPDQVNGLTNWHPAASAFFDGPDKNALPDTFDFDYGVKGTTEFWLSPRQWDSVKEVGLWSIDAGYGYFNNEFKLKQFGTTQTSFTVGPTVSPEPVSLALFGLGAGVLGLTRLRKRR